jgi:hypothetical protein
VDCVVEMASRVKYYEVEEELRKLGFKHPTTGSAPICRWEYSGIPVDVMPTEGKVLGFNNRWYAEGMANTRKADLPEGQEIEIFSAPYLLASKIEAFKDRGRGDFLVSRDIEDIVTMKLDTNVGRLSPWLSNVAQCGYSGYTLTHAEFGHLKAKGDYPPDTTPIGLDLWDSPSRKRGCVKITGGLF